MLDTPGTTDPIRPNSIGLLKQQDDAEGVRNALSPSDSTTLLNLATVMGRILLFHIDLLLGLISGLEWPKCPHPRLYCEHIWLHSIRPAFRDELPG